MIAGLIPILTYKFGPWIKKYFTVSAIQRARNCHWDPETNQVWSPNNDIISATLREDQEFNFLEGVELDLEVLKPPDEAGGTQAYVRGDDSISTFRPGARKQRKIKKKAEESAVPPDKDQVATSPTRTTEPDESTDHTNATNPTLPKTNSSKNPTSSGSKASKSSVKKATKTSDTATLPDTSDLRDTISSASWDTHLTSLKTELTQELASAMNNRLTSFEDEMKQLMVSTMESLAGGSSKAAGAPT